LFWRCGYVLWRLKCRHRARLHRLVDKASRCFSDMILAANTVTWRRGDYSKRSCWVLLSLLLMLRTRRLFGRHGWWRAHRRLHAGPRERGSYVCSLRWLWHVATVFLRVHEWRDAEEKMNGRIKAGKLRGRIDKVGRFYPIYFLFTNLSI
jgi:hypothetical protein